MDPIALGKSRRTSELGLIEGLRTRPWAPPLAWRWRACSHRVDAALSGQPGDPLTFGTMAGVLALVALAGCYLPARRATAVNPLLARRRNTRRANGHQDGVPCSQLGSPARHDPSVLVLAGAGWSCPAYTGPSRLRRGHRTVVNRRVRLWRFPPCRRPPASTAVNRCRRSGGRRCASPRHRAGNEIAGWSSIGAGLPSVARCLIVDRVNAHEPRRAAASTVLAEVRGAEASALPRLDVSDHIW